MNEAIYKQPLVLFLGAGASAPLGMKTAVKFLEQLRSQLLASAKFDFYNLLASVTSDIKASEEINKQHDVEAILDYIEQMANALKLLEKFGITKFETASASPDPNDCAALSEEVKDLVVNHYSEIDPKKAFELYRPLLETVILNPLPVFTTNYDLAWEKTYELTSSQSYEFHGAPFNLIDGFSRKRRTIPIWSSSAYEDYEPTGADLILFKLHGSVDWVRTPSGAIQRVESRKRDPGGMKTEIAYPSRLKREIHEEPYRTNYDYLLACLLHAKVCAVIGFSFRDQEIVEELRQAMKLNKMLNLVLIDPNVEAIASHLENKLGFKPRAELIKGEFTIQNAQSLTNMIVRARDEPI